MKRYLDAGKVCVAASKESVSDGRIVPDHTCALCAVDTRTSGLLLYNPWAEDSSQGALDEENDGFITITWSTFGRDFGKYYIA